MKFKGQISAEMLIVLAVLVAVAVFLAMQLTTLGKKSGQQIDESTRQIICQSALNKVGMPCTNNADCGNTTIRIDDEDVPVMNCGNNGCEVNTEACPGY